MASDDNVARLGGEDPSKVTFGWEGASGAGAGERSGLTATWYMWLRGALAMGLMIVDMVFSPLDLKVR
jgi:hypothetical protein